MPSGIDAALKKISRSTEEQAAQEEASRLGIPYANLDSYPFKLEVLKLVPIDLAQARHYAIYLRLGRKLKVAMVHPEDQDLVKELQTLAENAQAELEIVVVSGSSFSYLLRTYAELLEEAKQKAVALQQAQAQAKETDYVEKIKSLEDLVREAEHATTTQLLDILIAAALNLQASDIHVEPGEQRLSIRLRIDGVLQKVLELPMAQHKALLSRIKMMSKLKLDQSSIAQDGRFSLSDLGRDADIRVSTIPTGYGEGVVMRILRRESALLSIEQLGFSKVNQALIETAIRKPYGLILVTGPTGAGKSTTLYALLNALNSAEKKIITLEDPIEYRLDGVQQSQVNPEQGFSFAEGLRGALRQDPDVVMVGEIRDPETASIALNASLTGHLVLSTLHTNNASTAPTRFLEMGIPPFLLSGSIQLVIAQRLVRQLVPGSDPTNPQYQGRIIIGEALTPNQEFEQAVIAHQDQRALEEIAVRSGMVPMLQDGLEKVRQGLTTEAEIYRVTSA